MKHSVKVCGKKQKQDLFKDGKYSRVHTWHFDGGAEITALSSPQIIPIPMSDSSAVDPEEAFLAALSSCHMLFFLSVAAHQNYYIESYEDIIQGVLGKNTKGKQAIHHITLHLNVIFSGSKTPSDTQLIGMHETAHSKCFIANSILSKITIIPFKN